MSYNQNQRTVWEKENNVSDMQQELNYMYTDM